MNKLELKKLFIRIILYIALLPYAVAAVMLFSSFLLNIYVKHTFKKTYVQSINTPTYPKAKDILLEFNSYADGVIVQFENVENGRPIIIQEMSDFDDQIFPSVAGIAFPKFTGCVIKLNRELSAKEFRETLIHEYLHCYGYDHIEDEKDLMNPSLNYLDKDESIRDYARRLKEDFYESIF